MLEPNKNIRNINISFRISADDFNDFLAKIGNRKYEQTTASASQQNTGMIRPPANIFRPQPVKIIETIILTINYMLRKRKALLFASSDSACNGASSNCYH